MKKFHRDSFLLSVFLSMRRMTIFYVFSLFFLLLTFASYGQCDRFEDNLVDGSFGCDVEGYAGISAATDCEAYAYMYLQGGSYSCFGVYLADYSRARTGDGEIDVHWSGTITIQIMGQIFDHESFNLWDTYSMPWYCCECWGDNTGDADC